MAKLVKEEEESKKAAEEKKLVKMIETQEQNAMVDKSKLSQFFFDTKAGIAKPHEKKRYLHHRNLCEIAPRYNDHGFQEESIGRAYDHSGKDLNTLGDESDEGDHDKGDEKPHSARDATEKISGNRSKRTLSQTAPTKSSKKYRGIQVDEANPCWFCLSSPNVEKHLIIAIGEHCYLALAKGGLMDEHFLLIPIEHIQSLNSVENSRELLQELENFKKSLVRYFGEQSCDVIFFERNFKPVHWQLQVVPIPRNLGGNLADKIKTTSQVYFEKSKYIDIPKGCTVRTIVPPGAPYIWWQLEPTGESFVCEIQTKGSFFPVQLGRLILCDTKILNQPDRMDWKKCTKSKDEYVSLVSKVKEKYQTYDITK